MQARSVKKFVLMSKLEVSFTNPDEAWLTLTPRTASAVNKSCVRYGTQFAMPCADCKVDIDQQEARQWVTY
jgi:hypothetical protein